MVFVVIQSSSLSSRWFFTFSMLVQITDYFIYLYSAVLICETKSYCAFVSGSNCQTLCFLVSVIVLVYTLACISKLIIDYPSLTLLGCFFFLFYYEFLDFPKSIQSY